MNPAPTFDRVYLALKALTASGSFIPGDRLDFVALGDTLQVSITPVRDALYRLMGEGLVVAGHPDGFAMPTMLEADLRDLYDWTRELLLLAVRYARSGRGGGVEISPLEDIDLRQPDAASAVFAFIVQQAGNAEHLDAIRRANDRLAAVRAVEAAVLTDAAVDLTSIMSALRSGSRPLLRRQIIAYHRRRLRAVRDLVPALKRRDGRFRQI